MTGYHIRIGYNSKWNKDEAWHELVACVGRLRNDPARIIGEVVRLDGNVADAALLEAFARVYADTGDVTLTIRDTPEDRSVVQLASGGGPGRDLKERFRRAFCRLVIEEMHRLGIEVNLEVA